MIITMETLQILIWLVFLGIIIMTLIWALLASPDKQIVLGITFMLIWWLFYNILQNTSIWSVFLLAGLWFLSNGMTNIGRKSRKKSFF